MAAKKPEVLGIIVARGGSKSIDKKSIAKCAGKPLLYYTAEAAKRSKMITRLIISTNDEEMAEIARSFGVEVAFMRPEELAEDGTPDLPVFEHALSWLSENESYEPDVVVHLRPTTPLKRAIDIDRGVETLLSNPDAESVRSMCEPLHTPFKMYRMNEETGAIDPILKVEYSDVYKKFKEPFNMPRQELPRIWRHSGYVDVVRPHVIKNGSMSGANIYGLTFDGWRDVDIDTPRDLEYASMIIEEARKGGKEIWD